MAIAKVLVRAPTRPSNGASTIRRQLGVLARLSRVEVVPRQYKLVINWGNSAPIRTQQGVKVLNVPNAIAKAVNKLSAFRALQDAGVRVPLFQTERPVPDAGVWLARTTLHGSGGDGIIPIRRGDNVPAAPLYVRYIPKLIEYRIHVANGAVIFKQQKKRKSDAEQTADQRLIRNHANGWVYCPVAGNVTEEVSRAAVSAVAALGLSFGAVDLLVGRDDNLAYILEVNTAPGLESPGLIEAYTTAFRAQLGG